MNEYPLVILTKSNNVSSSNQNNWMEAEVEKAFVDFVERGGGLMVVHSGLAGYSQTSALRHLMGGVFVQHPAQCPVNIEPLEGHPLAMGAETYTVQDEHYFMEIDDPQADFFLTTRSENGSQPGGWTRLQGNGRVGVLTPGHNIEVWQHPSFQTLLMNTLRWCTQTQ
jgi:type 1 glutamine amidotransferase